LQSAFSNRSFYENALFIPGDGPLQPRSDGMAVGLKTRIAQWIILRNELHWAGWWIIFSVIGWTTGLTMLPGVFLTGTMAGTLTGLPLMLLLRPPGRIPSRT